MHGKKNVKLAPTCFGAITPSSGSELLMLAKIVSYGTSVYGDVVAYVSGSLLVCVYVALYTSV